LVVSLHQSSFSLPPPSPLSFPGDLRTRMRQGSAEWVCGSDVISSGPSFTSISLVASPPFSPLSSLQGGTAGELVMPPLKDMDGEYGMAMYSVKAFLPRRVFSSFLSVYETSKRRSYRVWYSKESGRTGGSIPPPFFPLSFLFPHKTFFFSRTRDEDTVYDSLRKKRDYSI